jgi:hypothetical protein
MKFLGNTIFEGSLYCIGIVVKDSDEVLELSIIWAKFLTFLSKLIELSRCSSNWIRVPKSYIKDAIIKIHTFIH